MHAFMHTYTTRLLHPCTIASYSGPLSSQTLIPSGVIPSSLYLLAMAVLQRLLVENEKLREEHSKLSAAASGSGGSAGIDVDTEVAFLQEVAAAILRRAPQVSALRLSGDDGACDLVDACAAPFVHGPSLRPILFDAEKLQVPCEQLSQLQTALAQLRELDGKPD